MYYVPIEKVLYGQSLEEKVVKVSRSSAESRSTMREKTKKPQQSKRLGPGGKEPCSGVSKILQVSRK